VNICKAKDGSIICDQNEVLTQWNEHCDDLLNKNNNQEHIAAEDEDIQPIEGPTVEDTDPPTFEELEEAINPLNAELNPICHLLVLLGAHHILHISRIRVKKLKNNKALGADGITAELFKQGGTELKNQMFRLILHIWVEEELPHDWNFGIICPILKKGGPMACSNYRGILLLNTAYKIPSNIIYAYLSEYTERIIGKYQCGF